MIISIIQRTFTMRCKVTIFFQNHQIFAAKTCVFGEIVVPLRVILRKKSVIF